MARTHSHGGVVCEHSTKKACDLARKIALGQCSEMIEAKGEPYPCAHWAVEKVGERGYCGQHIASVIRAEDERQRKTRLRAELDGRIDDYMAWRKAHPSVHSRMSRPKS
jgi:hypothetical protein